MGRIGDYPDEYNPKVHGPYDPSRYYGKPDTPLGQVKIGELGQWIMRRNKSPRAMVGVCSRAFFRWQMKYMLPKRSGMAPILQFSCAMMVLFYCINYLKMRPLRRYEYH